MFFLTQSPVYNVILKWNKCRDSGADKTEEMFQPVDDLIHLQLNFFLNMAVAQRAPS